MILSLQQQMQAEGVKMVDVNYLDRSATTILAGGSGERI